MQIQNRTSAGTKYGSLVYSRQEARAPARSAAFRSALRLWHHHVRRQAFTLASQPVSDPRTHARVAHQDTPRVDLVHGGRMHRTLCIEAAYEAQVVHALRNIRE